MRSAISRGLHLAMRARARASGLAKSPWSSPRLRSDRNVGQRIERELPVVAKRRERTLEERSDVLLHWSDALRFAGKMVVTPRRRPGCWELGSAARAARGQSILSEHAEL